MSRAHHLLGLPFAAMWRPPKHPFVTRADGIHRIPEFRSNAAAGGVAQHADAPAVLDYPSGFAAYLEVVAFVINRPGTLRLHVNAVVSGSDELLAHQWVFS